MGAGVAATGRGGRICGGREGARSVERVGGPGGDLGEGEEVKGEGGR